MPPSSPAPPGRAGRGSALTELAICLLPLGLALMGILLLGQLAMGSQEARKAVAWYLASPEARVQGDLEDRFFRWDRGRAEIPDKRAGVTPEPAVEWEEPVLPYGDRVGAATDLDAALARSLFYFTRTDGSQGWRDPKGVTAKLARLGLLASMDPPVGEPQAMQAIALLLGGTRNGGEPSPDAWLRYAAVQVDSYTGGLATLGLGQRELPLETPGETSDRFRGEWKLEGGDGQPLAWLEALVHPKEAFLGSHAPGAEPTVRLERMPGAIQTPEGESVSPKDPALMRGQFISADLSGLWSKTNHLR